MCGLIKSMSEQTTADDDDEYYSQSSDEVTHHYARDAHSNILECKRSTPSRNRNHSLCGSVDMIPYPDSMEAYQRRPKAPANAA